MDADSCAISARLLVMSRDAQFVEQLRACLPDFEVLALTEATTRHALERESTLLDALSLAVLDGSVAGAVRLRLYDRLRPASPVVAAPVVFARSGFPPTRADTPDGVDLYLPSESSVREVAWWCRQLACAPEASSRGRRSLRADATLPRPERSAPVRALSAMPSRRGGYGWIAQAGMWGVAAALAALTLWPVAERGGLGEALRARLQVLASAPAAFADGPLPGGPALRAGDR